MTEKTVLNRGTTRSVAYLDDEVRVCSGSKATGNRRRLDVRVLLNIAPGPRTSATPKR
jgi:hypothetical protein